MKLETVIGSFGENLINLSAEVKMSAKTAYQVSKVVQKVKKEAKDFHAAKDVCAKKYAKTDEKGEVILDKEKYIFEEKEKEESFKSEMKKLGEVEIELPKISLKELIESGAVLQPMYLEVLEPVLIQDME